MKTACRPRRAARTLVIARASTAGSSTAAVRASPACSLARPLALRRTTAAAFASDAEVQLHVVIACTGREEEDITSYMPTVAKGLNPFNEEAKLKPGLYKDAHGPVKDLDPDNFDETIMDMSADNNKVWIVEFYSDRCPICKGLVPEIKKAAEVTMKEYPGEVTKLPPHTETPAAIPSVTLRLHFRAL